MPVNPHIRAVASAFPTHQYQQIEICRAAQDSLLGAGWAQHPELAAQGKEMERLFTASHVAERQSTIDINDFYQRPRSTGERMQAYRTGAFALGKTALASAITDIPTESISDLVSVSCTGYTSPGLDVTLSRELGLSGSVRRVNVGHMGCFGAMVGIRQCLAATRAYPGATAILLCVELCTLHFTPTNDYEVLTSFALFGDAAAAIVVSSAPDATGPEIVDTHCATEFQTADQMTWNITDQGFIMTLSPRVPVSIRRVITKTVEELLAPHGLTRHDIKHWLVHPGGPSILEAVQGKLELTPEQMEFSWQVLRDHGNCSSATVLLILEALLASGRPQPGEWGVMMAFGPGLTLETCLLRF